MASVSTTSCYPCLEPPNAVTSADVALQKKAGTVLKVREADQTGTLPGWVVQLTGLACCCS